ncbi:6964_t:CDS:1, partial [Dentiscutata heterogama]
FHITHLSCISLYSITLPDSNATPTHRTQLRDDIRSTDHKVYNPHFLFARSSDHVPHDPYHPD